MPVFICDNCHTIENTATGHYWSRNHKDITHKDDLGKAVCSACPPPRYSDGKLMSGGKWHGRWKQEILTAEMLINGIHKPDHFMPSKGLEEVMKEAVMK